MRWKIVLEGTHEFESAHRSELTSDKNLGAPVGWRDRLLGRGWQGHHGSSPAGGRQPAVRGLRFIELLLYVLGPSSGCVIRIWLVRRYANCADVA